MAAPGRVVRLAARFAARRTLVRVTSVRYVVVTLGRQSTRLRALGRTRVLLSATSHIGTGQAATTLDRAALGTRIALAEVTQRGALVLVARQHFAAHLVARWTVFIATLRWARLEFGR